MQWTYCSCLYGLSLRQLETATRVDNWWSTISALFRFGIFYRTRIRNKKGFMTRTIDFNLFYGDWWSKLPDDAVPIYLELCSEMIATFFELLFQIDKKVEFPDSPSASLKFTEFEQWFMLSVMHQECTWAIIVPSLTGFFFACSLCVRCWCTPKWLTRKISAERIS